MYDYTAVVTAFNAEKTISDALESVLNQSIKPYEVILIDDNSEDYTVKIAENFKSLLSNFKIVVNSRNYGQSCGRNTASSLAKTNYLVFFDSDDISLPDRASLHWKHFSDGSDISFVSSIKKYPSGYQVNCLNSNLTTTPEVQDFVSLLLLGDHTGAYSDNYIPASTCGVYVPSFRKVSGFDESFRRLEDVDLAIRFAQSRCEFAWSAEVGVLRRHSENESKGRGIDMSFERELLIKYREVLGEKNFKSALLHMRTRQLFFSGDYVHLFTHAIKHPIYTIASLRKIRRLIDRIKHQSRIYS